jgi:hypothetical protein
MSSLLALRTLSRRSARIARSSLRRTQRRSFSFWTSEEKNAISITYGRPPIAYGYLFTMSYPVRMAIILAFAIQSDIVEHVYYGYPPEDWYYRRPKFWRKRLKPYPWGPSWRADSCDLMDVWCWKGVDPRDFFVDH